MERKIEVLCFEFWRKGETGFD